MNIGPLIGIFLGTLFSFPLGAATLHLCGSSQLDDGGRNPERWPYWSWGTEMEKYMPAPHEVRNLAASGHSTKSYKATGRWDKLIAEVKPGDFVGMQFGANDQKCNTDYYRQKRFAAANGLFRDIEREWVEQIRAKGATPIIISHSGRCLFDKDGKHIVDPGTSPDLKLGAYTEASRKLAEEMGCDFVDMQKMVRERSEALGKEEALKSYVISTGYCKGKDGEPSKDTTHPIKTGAEAQAKLFIDDVRRRGLSVARLFERKTVRANGDFESAFAAVGEAGGGVVVVPAGTWKAESVRLRSRCELRLEEGAVLECGGIDAKGCTNVFLIGKGEIRLVKGGKLDFSGCRGVRLKDFTLLGSDEPIDLRGATDTSVRGMTVKSAGSEPILAEGALDLVVEKCRFDRCDVKNLRTVARNALIRDLALDVN